MLPQGSTVVWQVRTGKAKRQKWSDCDETLAAKLEYAYQHGVDSFTHDWDGWVYYYEMSELMQHSPGEEGTERKLRRILRQEDGTIAQEAD